jgi:hypothetical protein
MAHDQTNVYQDRAALVDLAGQERLAQDAPSEPLSGLWRSMERMRRVRGPHALAPSNRVGQAPGTGTLPNQVPSNPYVW